MNAKTLTVLLILVTNFRIIQSRTYENYTLYSAMPTDMIHLKFLQSMESEKYIDAIFWRQPYKLYDYTQFMVNGRDKDSFYERMEHFHLSAKIMLEDVQSAFEHQTFQQYERLKAESFSWTQYHSLTDINQWLADIALAYPTIVDLESIGLSSEGREIYALGIKKNKEDVYKVIVEGGVHSTEWLSPLFVTYLINELLRAEETGNHELIHLSRRYHWFFIPLLNPDGYVYNQKEDRLWMKNRRVFSNGTGVNLNRNFDYHFGKYATSTDPSSSNYGGPTPFSEAETQALKTYVESRSYKLKFYFSFHGYGQTIIIPYSDRINHIENYAEMENYAKQATVKIFRKHGLKYNVGSAYDTFGHRISGESASWVKDTFKTPYVFTFLLRDDGSYGYALPPDQIKPTCEENLAGVIELMIARPKALRTNLFGSACPVKSTATLLQLLSFLVFLALK